MTAIKRAVTATIAKQPKATREKAAQPGEPTKLTTGFTDASSFEKKAASGSTQVSSICNYYWTKNSR